MQSKNLMKILMLFPILLFALPAMGQRIDLSCQTSSESAKDSSPPISISIIQIDGRYKVYWSDNDIDFKKPDGSWGKLTSISVTNSNIELKFESENFLLNSVVKDSRSVSISRINGAFKQIIYSSGLFDKGLSVMTTSGYCEKRKQNKF